MSIMGMGVAAATAAVGAAIGVLRDLKVDEETIAEIRKILDMGLESMNSPFPAVPASVFGGSGAGSELGHHTDLAHQKVLEAMVNMATGLEGYRESVDTFVREARGADEYSGEESQRTQARVDAAASCLAAPNVRTTPQQCAPPSTEG